MPPGAPEPAPAAPTTHAVEVYDATPRKVGRKPKPWTQELAKSLLGYIGTGHTVKAACALSRISQSFYYEQVRLGREHPELYPELAQFVEDLEAMEHLKDDIAHDVITSGLRSDDPRLATETAKWWLTHRQKQRHHEEGEKQDHRHLHLHASLADREAARAAVLRDPSIADRLNEGILARQLAAKGIAGERAGDHAVVRAPGLATPAGPAGPGGKPS